MRGLTAAVLAEIAKGQVEMFHLLELHFSTTVYLTTYYRDLNWSSNDYLSTDLISFGDITETTDLTVGSLSIVLSGGNQDNIATALTENFLNNQVLIYRGFMLSDSIVADPELLFDGRIDSFDLNESLTESKLTWSVSSHWADFEKVAGNMTNNNDQLSRYSGDLGFEFAAASTKDIKWGRA